MLHAGLDLSRKRLDVACSQTRRSWSKSARFPDSGGLKNLDRASRGIQRTCSGGDRVDDGALRPRHSRAIWLGGRDRRRPEGEGAGALAVKTDGSTRVLACSPSATWCRRSGCRTRVRQERELARFRLHLIKHRSQAEEPNPLGSDQLRARLPGHRPLRRGRRSAPRRAWIYRSPGGGTSTPALLLIDQLEAQVDEVNAKLRASGADHPYVPLLLTVPGVGWVLAFTIARDRRDLSLPTATS